MSFTDPSTDPAQPEDGQGAEGTNDAPYSEYLNRIPEEVRGQVEPVFRDWDANTTRRFQDHAEYRKTWEPYEQIGLSNVPQDEVQWLLQFRDALSQPEAIQTWFKGYAEQHNLSATDTPTEMPPDPSILDDPYGGDQQQLEQLLKAQLGPLQQQLEAMSAWREQQETTARMAEAERFVHSQIEELKTKHPQEFNEAAVEKLVAQYIETDPRNAVQRAFSDWQAIRSQIEKDTLQGKVNAPPPAESGGVADGSPEDVKTLAQAAAIAKERIRQSWGT